MIDTNIAILLRDGDDRVGALVGQQPGNSLLSIISHVELEGGVVKDPVEASTRRRRLDFMLESVTVLPFGKAEAAQYAAIVAVCGFSRRRILDRMIAATALTAGARLATLNPSDFNDIPGLGLVAW